MTNSALQIVIHRQRGIGRQAARRILPANIARARQQCNRVSSNRRTSQYIRLCAGEGLLVAEAPFTLSG